MEEQENLGRFCDGEKIISRIIEGKLGVFNLKKFPLENF